jgi:hypothetical protein
MTRASASLRDIAPAPAMVAEDLVRSCIVDLTAPRSDQRVVRSSAVRIRDAADAHVAA